MTAIHAPRGTRDLYGDEMARFALIETEARSLLARYGYSEIRTPIFEARNLFERSVGDATDIVAKELYNFKDRKDREMALRPEGTAGVVRAYIQNNLGAAGLAKYFYLGPMFRYERPQGGRYRQFYQLGCELFGADSVAADLEIIGIAERFLANLSVDAKLKINFIGCAECKKAYAAAIAAFFLPHADSLCGDCQKRITKNPLRLLDCKVPACGTIAETVPDQSLCEKCSTRFISIERGLKELEVSFVIDRRMVRGLDYYTGIVFEMTSQNLDAQDAILGGGRYDELVGELGGPKTPAIGFAIGLDRLARLVVPPSENPAHGASRTPFVYVIGFPDDPTHAAMRFSEKLRDVFPEKRIEQGLVARSLKAHLREADKLGASYVVIIGEDEIGKGSVTIKKMQDGSQSTAPMSSDETILRESFK